MRVPRVTAVRSGGLSLLEIVLAVAAIALTAGVLVVLAMPEEDGEELTRERLAKVEEALDLYRTHVASYPGADDGGLDALIRRPGEGAELWAGPYVADTALLEDAWGNRFRYGLRSEGLAVDEAGPEFFLFSLGPDGLAATDDDVRLYEVAEIGAGAPGE